MSQFLPFALHGQHLNVGQVLMGAIQAGNGDFVSDSGQEQSISGRSANLPLLSEICQSAIGPISAAISTVALRPSPVVRIVTIESNKPPFVQLGSKSRSLTVTLACSTVSVAALTGVAGAIRSKAAIQRIITFSLLSAAGAMTPQPKHHRNSGTSHAALFTARRHRTRGARRRTDRSRTGRGLRCSQRGPPRHWSKTELRRHKFRLGCPSQPRLHASSRRRVYLRCGTEIGRAHV